MGKKKFLVISLHGWLPLFDKFIRFTKFHMCIHYLVRFSHFHFLFTNIPCFCTNLKIWPVLFWYVMDSSDYLRIYIRIRFVNGSSIFLVFDYLRVWAVFCNFLNELCFRLKKQFTKRFTEICIKPWASGSIFENGIRVSAHQWPYILQFSITTLNLLLKIRIIHTKMSNWRTKNTIKLGWYLWFVIQHLE